MTNNDARRELVKIVTAARIVIRNSAFFRHSYFVIRHFALFRGLSFDLDQFCLRHAGAGAEADGELTQLGDAALPRDKALRRIGYWKRHWLNLAAADESHAFGQLESQRLADDRIMNEGGDGELFAGLK